MIRFMPFCESVLEWPGDFRDHALKLLVSKTKEYKGRPPAYGLLRVAFRPRQSRRPGNYLN